ncbi:coproporphyrinogen dehydrogenase HemZ [Caldicellulosiruptoraceae bacterium PP1]
MNISYKINSHRFSYDLEHLIRAFFPDCNVKKDKEQFDIQVEAIIDELKFSIKIYDKEGYQNQLEGTFINIQSEDKKLFGKAVYNILKIYTKRDLPWGILTGIRPTKIVYDLIKKEIDINDIPNVLEKDYLISTKKRDILTEVAIKEIDIINSIPNNAAALYVGIPICPSICLYCSFSCIESNFSELINKYTDALIKHIEEIAKQIEKDKKKIVAIYFGGGTPTTIGINNIERIFRRIFSILDMKYINEITFEAGRPDTIDKNILEVLKDRITRICINPQSANNETLTKIGRNHSFEDIVKAFELSRAFGINNINSDLIIGLPDENIEDYLNTLNKVIELNPASITIHTLSIKRSSKLKMEVENYNFMSAEDANYCIDESFNKLKKHQYFPYYLYRQKNMIGNFENIGYSKKGYEGLYNCMIMQEKHNIYACGAKSVSKYIFENDRIERVFNPADINLYIKRILG